jgi:lipopolysaccharide heptosyltransferase II
MRILFITLSNIGDVILTLPVLGVLLRSFPKSQISVLTGPRAKQVFEQDPRINELFIYDKRGRLLEKLSLMNDLRKRKFDLAIDLRNSMIPFFAAIKQNATLFSKTPKGITHKGKIHLQRIQSLGLKIKDALLEVYIGPEEAKFADSLKQQAGSKYIVVAPGARSHIKRWKKDGFTEVCRRLANDFQAKIVLMGDEQDREVTRDIANSLSGKIIDLAGKTSIKQAAAVLKSAGLLITNDSALLHLGCNVGVPVVAVFGPTDPKKYGPTGRQDAVVRKKMKCSPCQRPQCKKGDMACMNDLSADEVYKAAKNILENV